MFFNFSVALEDAFREVDDSAWVSPGRRLGVGGKFGIKIGSNVEEGSLGVGVLSTPGCLKIPKLIDFFCG